MRRAPAQRADGSNFTAEFTVLALMTEDAMSEEAGVVITLRDVSAMSETVRTLRQRVAQLEAHMQRLIAVTRPPTTALGAAQEGTMSDATVDSNLPVVERIKALLTSHVQCVLATTAANLTPAQYLMAYDVSPCLRTVLVATPRQARKAQQMMERPRVSVLWDNRTGNLTDHSAGSLVVATGDASTVPRVELASASKHFLARNPNMASFLSSEAVALFQISVDSFEITEGYGRPERWDPRCRP